MEEIKKYNKVVLGDWSQYDPERCHDGGCYGFWTTYTIPGCLRVNSKSPTEPRQISITVRSVVLLETTTTTMKAAMNVTSMTVFPNRSWPISSASTRRMMTIRSAWNSRLYPLKTAILTFQALVWRLFIFCPYFT